MSAPRHLFLKRPGVICAFHVFIQPTECCKLPSCRYLSHAGGYQSPTSVSALCIQHFRVQSRIRRKYRSVLSLFRGMSVNSFGNEIMDTSLSGMQGGSGSKLVLLKRVEINTQSLGCSGRDLFRDWMIF